MDDTDLIQRACQLEQKAISQLYQEHVQAIYRYVYYRVGSVQLAEDITAEVFLRAIDSLPNYRPRGAPFRAWLYRIARARVADHFREKKRMATTSLETEIESDDVSPQQQIERAHAIQRLQHSLLELTHDQQKVIVLKFVEAMSNAEIAQMMDKTVGSIKSLQHRALRALYRLITNSNA